MDMTARCSLKPKKRGGEGFIYSFKLTHLVQEKREKGVGVRCGKGNGVTFINQIKN